MAVKSRTGSAALRKGRWSAENQIYLITTRTLNRAPVFANFHYARTLTGVLKEEYLRGYCTTMAYVVMPDHLHWLLRLDVGELSLVVGRVKSLSARRIGKRIWQTGFHDHGLRREENMLSIARYIIMNPVRAGLVERPGLYPHWDTIWL